MKQNYYLLMALLASALAGCTSDGFEELVEDNNVTTPDVSDQISFAPLRKNMTRGNIEGDAAADLLNKQFFVYGEKSSASTPVFPQYDVEYVGLGSLTESNLKGWEYVGLPGYENQSIRYWDYAADNYKFIAWAATNSGATVSDVNMNGFKVKANTPDQMAQFYVADKKQVNKSDYQQIVTLTFRSLASKARIAIYEEIPGYSVSEVTFRYAAVDGYMPLGTRYSTDAILDGSFNSAKGGDFTITYPDSSGVAEVALPATEPVSRYNFGAFPQAAIGVNASEATFANGGSSNYLIVMPNQDHAAPMQLVINYTLISDDGKDTIRVKGAHVTVPAEYMVWKPNFAYTYYFKLTKDTNGTTGRDPYNPDPHDGDDPYYPDPKDIDPTDPDGPGPNPFYPYDPTDPYNPYGPNPKPNPDDPDGPDPYVGPFNPTDPDAPKPYDPNDPNKDVEGLYPIVFDAVVVDFDDCTDESEWELKD